MLYIISLVSSPEKKVLNEYFSHKKAYQQYIKKGGGLARYFITVYNQFPTNVNWNVHNNLLLTCWHPKLTAEHEKGWSEPGQLLHSGTPSQQKQGQMLVPIMLVLISDNDQLSSEWSVATFHETITLQVKQRSKCLPDAQLFANFSHDC